MINRKNIFLISFSIFTLTLSIFNTQKIYACVDQSAACNYDADDTTDCFYETCNNTACVRDQSECPVNTEYVPYCGQSGHGNTSSYDECAAANPQASCYEDNTTCTDENNCDNPGQIRCGDGICRYDCGGDQNPPEQCNPNQDPTQCERYYCSLPPTDNAEAGCKALNPQNMGYICLPSEDSCNEYYYCSDPNDIAFDPGGVACAAANGNDPEALCIGTVAVGNPTTRYRPCTGQGAVTYYYCPTHPDEPQTCQDSIPNGTTGSCESKDSVCLSSYCGFDVLVQYESKGVLYKVEVVASYWYDPYVDSCVVPNTDEIGQLMADTLDPLPNPPASVSTSTGLPITPLADQCPNIDEDQSYADFIANYTRDDAGNCVDNPPVCDPDHPEQCSHLVNGVCGSAAGSTIVPDTVHSGDTLLYACSAGQATPVSVSGSTYRWDCNGSGGGDDANCAASLGCPDGKYYCDYTFSCELNSVACNPTLPDAENVAIGGHDGPVHLNALKVFPPLIPSDDACHIKWDKDSNVFYSYASSSAANPTHCILSDQDGILKSFDPASDVTLGFDESHVKKDKLFTLKCWDGNDIAHPETITGACRINVKQGEFN